MCIGNVFVLAVISSAVMTASEKPDFSGKWRMETSSSESAVILNIDQKEGELRISSAPEQKDAIDIACNTMGKECECTVNGKRVRVSYWYNGPMLVEMVFEGKNNERVTETRRRLSEDGQRMLVEVIPIVPEGKSREKLAFVRDQQVTCGVEWIRPLKFSRCGSRRLCSNANGHCRSPITDPDTNWYAAMRS